MDGSHTRAPSPQSPPWLMPGYALCCSAIPHVVRPAHLTLQTKLSAYIWPSTSTHAEPLCLAIRSGAGGAIQKLASMGFSASDFAGAMTSGEVTHQHLSTRPTPMLQQLGSRCIHLTWGARGSVSLDGCNVTVRCRTSEAALTTLTEPPLPSRDPSECRCAFTGGSEPRGGGLCAGAWDGGLGLWRIAGPTAVQHSGDGDALEAMRCAD